MSELVDGPLSPDVEHLEFLLGTWRGEGRGDYPTTEEFRYEEEMRFEHAGDAFLLYAQRSWLVDGSGLHFERGFLRPGAEPGSVELTLAHPLGLTEIAEGRVEGTELRLASTDVGRTSTGSAVTGLTRTYSVEGDVLRYSEDMAMEDTPMTWHVAGELRRIEP